MLLVMDIGNTNIKLGLFKDDILLESWRISAQRIYTADELGVIIESLFSRSTKFSFTDVEDIIMASVQPALNYTIEHVCAYYMGKKPIVVNSRIKTGLNFLYTNPEELGADRIVNAVAVFEIYKGACIVIDCGTATTFSGIDEKGNFLGGAIAPGIKASADALTEVASKLPKIEIIKPASVIGKTTISNMQSGIIYGFTGLVNNIAWEMKKEKELNHAKVIATGGLSELINFDEKLKVIKDRTLSLYGLKRIYDINKEKKQ